MELKVQPGVLTGNRLRSHRLTVHIPHQGKATLQSTLLALTEDFTQ